MIAKTTKLRDNNSEGSPKDYTVSSKETKGGTVYHVRSKGQYEAGQGMALYHHFGHWFVPDFHTSKWNCPKGSNWVEFESAEEREWFTTGPGKHKDWATHIKDGEIPPKGLRISTRQILILLVLEKTRTLEFLWDPDSNIGPDLIQPLSRLIGLNVPVPKGEKTYTTGYARLPDKIREVWEDEVARPFPKDLKYLPAEPCKAPSVLINYQAKKDDRVFMKHLHRNFQIQELDIDKTLDLLKELKNTGFPIRPLIRREGGKKFSPEDNQNCNWQAFLKIYCPNDNLMLHASLGSYFFNIKTLKQRHKHASLRWARSSNTKPEDKLQPGQALEVAQSAYLFSNHWMLDFIHAVNCDTARFEIPWLEPTAAAERVLEGYLTSEKPDQHLEKLVEIIGKNAFGKTTAELPQIIERLRIPSEMKTRKTKLLQAIINRLL